MTQGATASRRTGISTSRSTVQVTKASVTRTMSFFWRQSSSGFWTGLFGLKPKCLY